MPVTFSFFTNIDPFNPTSPSSYVRVSGSAPVCVGNQQVCSIYAQVDENDLPIISSGLSTEITSAITNHTPTTNVKLRA